MKNIVLLLAFSALPLLSGGNAEAWSYANPARYSNVKFDTALWYEGLEGETPFTVEFCDGAKGKVEIIKGAGRNGGNALLTEKSNNAGFIVVKFKKHLQVKNGDKLQFNAFYQGSNASSKYSGAILRLQPVGVRDFELYTFYPGIYGGERMQIIVNTPENTWEKKIAQRVIKDNITQVEPVLVLIGAAGTAVWDDFYIENEKNAAANWSRTLSRSTPRDRSSQCISDAEVDKVLANSVDHTGKVVKINGNTRLLIDGKVSLPVINGPYLHYVNGKNYSNAGDFAKAGVQIMRPFIRLGEGFPKKTYPGFWKEDESLDVKGAVDMIRQTMRLAPNAKIMLTIGLHPYWKFAEKYPEEAWITEKGHPAYGNGIHLTEVQNGKRPNANYCVWPSYYSPKLHGLYKKQIALLVAELKRTGLSKAIVGLHIAGGHDNQMTVTELDYSPHALREFRKFLKEEYKTVEALRKAWNDPKVTFETAYAAKINTTKDCFSPEKEQPVVDFYRFNKVGAWRVAGEIGDYARKLFGKDMFLVRYCQGAYSGNFAATMDLDDFLRNQKFDAICGQAPYGTRPPGAVNQQVLPFASMHRHGKLYINEFDIRTYVAAPGWEKEMMSVTWGLIIDINSWRSANRKLAGVMFANDMGFWYDDGAPGWYDDDQIMAEIKSSTAAGKAELQRASSNWQPEVALVVDGKGMFYRNPSARYMFDFTSLLFYQNGILASSSVPYSYCMLEDLLEDPEYARKFKVLIFAGMFNIDAKRQKLLDTLKNSNRTLIFLSGTGRISGAEKGTGFSITAGKRVTDHRVNAVEGVPFNMLSYWQLQQDIERLGKPEWYDWLSLIWLKPDAQSKVLARYNFNKEAAVAEKKFANWKSVYIGEAGGLTPEYFNHLVKEAGAYTLCKPGFQCETNGSFMMVHCLEGGKNSFKMPFKADVTNLFNGKIYRGVTEIPVNAEAASTYWFRLEPSR